MAAPLYYFAAVANWIIGQEPLPLVETSPIPRGAANDRRDLEPAPEAGRGWLLKRLRATHCALLAVSMGLKLPFARVKTTSAGPATYPIRVPDLTSGTNRDPTLPSAGGPYSEDPTSGPAGSPSAMRRRDRARNPLVPPVCRLAFPDAVAGRPRCSGRSPIAHRHVLERRFSTLRDRQSRDGRARAFDPTRTHPRGQHRRARREQGGHPSTAESAPMRGNRHSLGDSRC